MVVRVSMKIFMIFGIVKMLQLNTFWNLSKMALTKPYEQIWGKTFYFGPPIFVEVLKVNSSLYEFLWDFRKCPGALIKWLNPAVGLVCKCFKSSRDLFANFLSLSPLHCGDGVLAPYCLAGRPRHAAAGSLSAGPPLVVVKNATRPPT